MRDILSSHKRPRLVHYLSVIGVHTCSHGHIQNVYRCHGQSQLSFILRCHSLYFFRQTLLPGWVSLLRLGWLVSEPQGSLCLCSPTLELWACTTMPGCFACALGIASYSSCFTHWASLPSTRLYWQVFPNLWGVNLLKKLMNHVKKVQSTHSKNSQLLAYSQWIDAILLCFSAVSSLSTPLVIFLPLVHSSLS